MRLAAILWAVVTFTAAAQTFTLGTSSDPCTGGNPLVIANSTNTVRWGDFTCTFQLQTSAGAPPIDGPYTVRLEFLEPCAQVNACSGGQVTKAGQRVQGVTVNGSSVLSGFDPFAAGATDTTPAVRKFLIFPINGTVVVRLQTVLRSGVLSKVAIFPTTLPWSPAVPILPSSQTGSDNVWVGRNDFGPASFFALPRRTQDPACPPDSSQMWVNQGILKVCLNGAVKSFVPAN